MLTTLRSIAGVTGLTLAFVAFPMQQATTSQQDCDAPFYFGICDPYVPGTIVSVVPDGKSINVLNTWPDGPAEKAGVCPGDQITAVDSDPVLGHTWQQMLKEIVSPTPSPITLKVKRGSEEMEFHFYRVRESTLALLSHEKFLLHRGPFSGIRSGIVPLDETREELQEVAHFFDGIDRRLGFKFIDGKDVPEGTPEEQVKKLTATERGGPEETRHVGETHFARTENSSVAGFGAVLLKNPEEVLVNAVIPGSAAQHTGLFPGDQILEVNGHPVAGLNEGQLTDLIFKPDEPREISLRIRRGSSAVSLKIQTQKLDESAITNVLQQIPDQRTPIKPDTYILGPYVLYAENPKEAMVDEVDYPSPAFDAGLHVGDRILEVNSVPMEQLTLQQLREMLQPQGASDLKIEVSRLGKKLEFQIKATTFAEAQAKIGRKITKKGPMPVHCPEG